MENFSTDKILRSEIAELGLSYDALNLLNKVDGIVKLKTVSDVASLTRIELLSLFVDSGVSYDIISNVVEEIEETLESKGIYLGDARAQILQGEKSEKEIEEAKLIRISSLIENPYLINKLERLGIYSLGDFSNVYVSDIRRLLTDRQREDFKIIVDAINENGLSFKQKHSYAYFNDPKVPYINVEELSEEEAEDFYSRPLSDFGFPQPVIDKLKEKGIDNIGELSMLYANELRMAINKNLELMSKIKEVLSRYNIQIHYVADEYYFEDPKIEPKDISKMSLEERYEFYSRPLSDIGVSERVEKYLQEKGIESIGDVEALTPKQIRRLLKNLNYSTLTKLLNTLAIFGVDKREEIPDRRFKDATKPKVNIESLSDEEREKYLKSSIVGMGFSDNIIAKFKSIGVETIEDLSKISSRDIRKMVNESPTTLMRIKSIMREYGLEPRKVSTFFEEPKVKYFNYNEVDEVKQKKFMERPIEDLGISGVLAETLKSKNILTIGQLSSLTIKDLKTDFNARQYTVHRLKERLNEFGIELKYEKVEESKDLIEKADMPSMNEEERAAFLSKPITEFKLDKFTQKRLKEAGIETLWDLMSYEKPELRAKLKANNVMMNELELLIGNLGERMKGSWCLVVDGKLVFKSEDINKIKYPRKVELVDIKTLPLEEREKMLDTRLEDLGLHVRAVDLIQKKSKIKTIRDIQSLDLGELKGLLARNEEYVEETLSVLGACGITFEYKEKQTTKGRTYKSTIDVEKLGNKEEILGLKLTDIGISFKIAQKLKNELGVVTVEDLTNTTKNRLRYLEEENKYYLSNVCEKALKNVGLSLKPVEKKSREPEKMLDPIDLSTLPKEELIEISKHSIQTLGLSKKTTRILMQEYDIKTIGDFLSLSAIEVYNFLYDNDHLYNKTYERMLEFGLKMPELKDMKKMVKKGIRRDSEDDEFTRKMKHYGAYLEYMKSKENSSSNADEDSGSEK